MSHLKERKEKNCLNCNAQVHGKYCHICGQENIEPKESVWHLVNHFFQDITHFDGNFFTSLKYLVAKPGFLSKEYMNGRRASYLNPVRMYIFTSAFFFLIFFSFFRTPDEVNSKGTPGNGGTVTQLKATDTAALPGHKNNNRQHNAAQADTVDKAGKKYYDAEAADTGGLQFTAGQYRSKKEYDSLLQSGTKKHNWLQRKLTYKQIELNEKFKGRGQEAFDAAGEAFVHKIPQMLFISLPLLALLLRLMYVRRKEFYYVSHAMFSIHLYIFIFITILCSLSLGKINDALHWGVISFLRGFLVVGIFFYLYKAMRNFYGQQRLKTALKFLLLNISFSMIMGILFIFFILFSLFSI